MKLSLSNLFSWIWANTDNITKWIHVVALVVAGYWTYTRFIRVEAPSLEPVARVMTKDNTPSITRHDGLCRFNIGIIVRNEGHSSFEIRRVQIQGWQSSAPQPQAGNPAYFDVKKMQEGTQILKVDSLPDSFLNRPYPPGSQYDQNFEWDFKRIDPIWMFEVTAYGKDDKPLGSVRQWADYGCVG
jgi:hypothetical protein